MSNYIESPITIQQGVAKTPGKEMGYRDYVADVGAYASLIGLLFSIWVLISLKRIKGQFLFQARYPALRKAIESHSKSISDLMNAFPNSAPDIEVELERCVRNLKNLKSKVNGAPRESIQILIAKIGKLKKPLSDTSKGEIRDIYLGLTGLEIDLKNFSEDQKWRSEQ